ncbi:Protein of unknown function DUF2490 [Pseudopedobacter saltans DSM 12145]|uniref:DUF2490 domain-containing protein n=1 Tax=Pseudopedobacter saltans (strain ATCC 51119 / DSM 12145 / JCM 21818 / CCUG 39354 / LMG 10337 / NBRC 100064 / NCIMB 13643) TaxID=762903 RepID=F0S9W8_PSESL|nr:DUF2490 domain-containing protein [Pseudopedobacter saltans]ADY52526.1 Protein of unknown function DUF2490 [Pseudopedobacter saltans DSM 12145]
MRHKIILLLVISFISSASFGQNEYKLGIISLLNTDVSFKNQWKLNTKLESRYILSEGEVKTPINFNNRYERSDLEFILTKKLNSIHTLGAGYLGRLKENGDLIHRFIQQYAFIQKSGSMRIAHRFRTDETFGKSEDFRFRLRYRISTDKALEGQTIDEKEFYLKFSNEYLGSYQNSDINLEIRALAALGYNFNDSSKVEAGLDYRMEDMLNETKTHLGWLNIGWYYSF